MIFEMWQSGGVPADWRRGNMTPIFKKREKGDLGNYRLLSLTSVPCSLKELILLEAAEAHKQ